MTETTKRSLRTRKPPPYFTADVLTPMTQSEDPEQVSYAKKIYVKEYVSPAQELNSLAKIMSKFVNSANKHLRQSSQSDVVEGKGFKTNQQSIQEKQVKKNEINNEGPKKKGHMKIEIKDDGTKKSKQTYTYKEQSIHPNLPKDGIKNQENNMKELIKQKQSNSINTSNINGTHHSSFLGQTNQIHLQQQISAIQNLQSNLTNQTILQQQQQTLNNSNPFLRQQFIPNKQIQQRHHLNKDKLFGRAAFHAAIAYHIYLKKLKQSGADITSQSLLDPTYNAKKIKGDYQDTCNGKNQNQ